MQHAQNRGNPSQRSRILHSPEGGFCQTTPQIVVTILVMNLEWDEKKRLVNLQKHKIDFIGSEQIFDGYTVSFEDDRIDYNEQRFVTFGVLEEHVVAVVHTERNENIRIISIRKATKREERCYYATITN